MAANFGGVVMRERRLAAVIFLASVAAVGMCAPASAQDSAAKKSLTVEQIFGNGELSGQRTRAIAWSPDGRRLSFLVATGTGKSAKSELWEMDTKSGERHLLGAADKLAAALQPSSAPASQATGIARRPAAQYLRAPDGNSLFFVGPTSFTWFDLKNQAAKSLVQGDDAIADAKISPDGKWVSYVLDYNLWTVSTAGGEAHSLTKGGREELHEGQLDWVYPEELQIGTAYWWSPDSSSIAYLEMDERPVTKFPIQNSLEEPAETEWERYPAAGSANPIVKVFVVDAKGGTPRQMDTGSNTDIYIPRVNWLPDSRNVAIE